MSVRGMVLLRLPLLPVTVRVELLLVMPMAAENRTEKVSEPEEVTVALTPVGKPLTEMLTAPEKPPVRLTVTWVVALEPDMRFTVEGLAAREKPGLVEPERSP